MKLTKRHAKIVNAAIDEWEANQALVPDKAQELRASIEHVWLDWKKLARISIRISIVCIIIAVFSLLFDEALLKLLESLIDISAASGMVALSIIAALFCWWGIGRRNRFPDKHYSTEVIFLFAALAIAGAIVCLGIVFSSGSDNFTPLLLLAACIYALLGFFIPSRLIWVFSLGCFGGWFGAVTGYVSGWGCYYAGMNYPLRFVLFGGALTALGYYMASHSRLQELNTTTRATGLLYLFVALWIMSIFGNYGDMDNWYHAHRYELFHWVIIFGAAAVGAIYVGLRLDDGMMRGFGLTFLFINLYTRFFEYFWSPLNKALFFAVLAASFWYIGSRAEHIWSLGGRVSKTPKKRSDSPGPQEKPTIHDLEL